MNGKFYVICDPDSTDSFIVVDGESVAPKAHDTEAEAIASAKEYSTECLVVQAVARVIEVSRHRVEKLK